MQTDNRASHSLDNPELVDCLRCLSFKVLKNSCSTDQINGSGMQVCNFSYNSVGIKEKLGTQLQQYPVYPNKPLNCLLVIGLGYLCIPAKQSPSSLSSSEDRMCLKYLTD